MEFKDLVSKLKARIEQYNMKYSNEDDLRDVSSVFEPLSKVVRALWNR